MTRELILIDDIYKAFGPKVVFEGISLRIEEGDRIGIVGHNGSGKTTLLNLISDQEVDMGDIKFSPGLRIAYLTQIRDLDEDATIEQELGRRGRQFEDLENEIASIEAQMADPSFYDSDWQPIMDRYSELQSMMAKSGGMDAAGHAQNIMESLGLGHHPLDMPLSSLSGGERAKVALARQLVGLDDIDVLFLDEPTNHLDIETLEWLEEFLLDFQGALLIVSHDRYFLDKVANNIVEVADAKIKGFNGNYSRFIQQKELFLQTLDDRIEKAEKEIKRLTGALQSMKRANKYDKSISQKRFMLNRAQGELRWLKSIKPRQRKNLHFQLTATDKASMEIADLDEATLTFEGLDRPLLDSVRVGISKGQRIGIVGGNGAGKTTLLRVLIGEIPLDSGKIDVPPGVQIGYFHQDHRTLNFQATPVEQIQKLKPRMEYGDIRALLGRFQFTSEQVSTKLADLSGGERARIAMLKLLLEENNVLLLDEPTNHLDIQAKEALEDALAEYDGTLVIVSHDRYFLDQVCNTIWHLPSDGSLKVYPGNYSAFMQRVSK